VEINNDDDYDDVVAQAASVHMKFRPQDSERRERLGVRAERGKSEQLFVHCV
jgi:hypothetical protein